MGGGGGGVGIEERRARTYRNAVHILKAGATLSFFKSDSRRMEDNPQEGEDKKYEGVENVK